MVKTVLIVNCDPPESLRLTKIAAQLDLRAESADDVSAFRGNGHGAPDLVVLDLDIAFPDAVKALARAREAFGAPIVALVGAASSGRTEEFTAAGAADVLFKPVTPERVEIALKTLLRISALEGELSRMRHRVEGHSDFSTLIAVSSEMLRARTLAQRAADLDLPILIEGEPGTGKRLLARIVHSAGTRAAMPLRFMRPQAGTGRERASETDPVALAAAWVEAEGGVLFVEEVGELPGGTQALLSERLADLTAGHPADTGGVRLICSSSKNLIEQVKQGQFREDLYYRINVFPIWLPPLRDRPDDIPALSQHFLKQVIAEEGKPIEEIESEAMALLKAYVWPGNVRQLENAIFRAVILAEGNRLTLRDFPQIAAQVPGFQSSVPAPAPFPTQQRYEGPAMIGGTSPSNRAITLTPFPNSTMVGIPALTDQGEVRRLDEIEADLIRIALGHYRGHITEVARRLGIGRSTLYRKMREFGLSGRHN